MSVSMECTLTVVDSPLMSVSMECTLTVVEAPLMSVSMECTLTVVAPKLPVAAIAQCPIMPRCLRGVQKQYGTRGGFSPKWAFHVSLAFVC